MTASQKSAGFATVSYHVHLFDECDDPVAGEGLSLAAADPARAERAGREPGDRPFKCLHCGGTTFRMLARPGIVECLGCGRSQPPSQQPA
jgi:hypothetical protein